MSTAVPSQTRQTDDALEMGDENAAFLSGPPRSGQLSLFAQKLITQCFIWLASAVVLGSTADFARDAPDSNCNILCILSILVGVFSFFFCTLILVGHILVWSGKIDNSKWFSPGASTEKHFMSFLTFLWVFGVSFLSAHKDVVPVEGTNGEEENPHTTGLAIIFGWLALFAAIIGTYKAYHAQKEEMKSLRYAQILSMQATEEEEYANFS